MNAPLTLEPATDEAGNYSPHLLAALRGETTGDPLRVREDVPCDWEDACPCGDGLVQCLKPSRFTVDRSRPLPGYDPAETCAEHLAEMTLAVLDGADDVHAVVKPRWL